jgi:hypothetical protein
VCVYNIFNRKSNRSVKRWAMGAHESDRMYIILWTKYEVSTSGLLTPVGQTTGSGLSVRYKFFSPFGQMTRTRDRLPTSIAVSSFPQR